MSRRTLVILVVIGLAIIIAGIFFLIRSRQAPPPTQTETQPQDLVSVSSPAETGGWQLVRHPIFNITFKLPPAWKITIFDNGKGEVSSSFSGEGFNAVVGVSIQNNLIGATPDDVLLGNKNSFRISRGQVEGVGYISQITREDESGESEPGGGIPDSYILINQYFVNDEILEISCSLLGPNYKTMIPTCEEIVKSLQFAQ